MKIGDLVRFDHKGVIYTGKIAQTGRLGATSVVVQCQHKRFAFFGRDIGKLTVM